MHMQVIQYHALESMIANMPHFTMTLQREEQTLRNFGKMAVRITIIIQLQLLVNTKQVQHVSVHVVAHSWNGKNEMKQSSFHLEEKKVFTRVQSEHYQEHHLVNA